MEPDIEQLEHHSEDLDDYACGSDEADELEGYEDEEEVFDRQAYGLYQQLPIKKGAPDLSAGPPQTAEEYLRRVRYTQKLEIYCYRICLKSQDLTHDVNAVSQV